MIKPGDIVLFKYPYTDYTGEKRRPVVIIAERPDFENEFLITFLTSQTSDFNKEWDIELEPESKRDHQTNLKKKTLIKTTKLMIISYSRLTGKIGSVDIFVLSQVKENIKRWLTLQCHVIPSLCSRAVSERSEESLSLRSFLLV